MKIVLNDQVEADLNATPQINTDGTMNLTTQKVLTDDTSGEQVNDGDPVTTALTTDQVTQINTALQPIIEGIVNAVPNPNAGGGTTTTGDDTASNN